MFWGALDATRRTVFNLIFLLFLIVIISAIFSGGPKPIAPRTALVLELKGELVEQHSGTVRDVFVAGLSGDNQKSVQLHGHPDRARDGGKRQEHHHHRPAAGRARRCLSLATLHEVGAALDRAKAAKQESGRLGRRL
ncbi:hypothetical protein LP420_33695 [Massilia sp. B-10]|nr:hypothetical protein LP420_33695 [Massilia sp. B-10]